MKDDAELGSIGDFLADRVVMEVESNLRSRFQEPPRAFGEDVAVLADCELVQEIGAFAVAVVAVAVGGVIAFDGIRQEVVNDRGLPRL